MDRSHARVPDVLTEQQSLPLDVKEASVALSAGAGCGKTTVLTARFLRDLEGPERRPLREIVALTFTEKAARELRRRIRELCRAKLASSEDPVHWRSVLRGLEAAPIGTFHQFCGLWLRRHATEAGIDPDFSVLDEAIAGTVRDEALAKSVRRWLAESNPDLIELAVDFGLSQVREALSALLAQRALGEIDAWVGRTPDDLIATWREAWEGRGRQARLHKVKQAADGCVATLATHQTTHPKMREQRAFLLEHLPDLKHIQPSDDWLAEVRENTLLSKVRGKNNWPSAAIEEAVKAALKTLCKAIDDFKDRTRWDEAATREAAEHGLRFARLAAGARGGYDAAKRARGGLDFDDLLLKTRALLRNAPEGSDLPPEEAIMRLLIDEFQDTDPVQSEILDRLGGSQVNQGRLFLVGDFKQSIYRFRGAQPRIFQDFHHRFPEGGRLALTENFRSVPGILDFVNALFADAFDGGDNRLVPARLATAPETTPAVEFLWAVESDEEAPESKYVKDRRKVEARWLARRLRQRIDAGWLIRDKEKGPKQADAGDVVFLFRAMTDATIYADALHEEGFDYHVIGGSAFYLQQEVHDLINLLSVIEDPCDAVSLAGALRSPFFCLSDEGLFWLGASRQGGLVEGLERVEAIAELSALDRRHAERAQGLLRHWRSIKDRVPIASLVDRVLDESGYEAALLAEFLGDRKRANVRKLVRLARRFDLEGGFTIAAFVARLRADLRRPPREEEAATADAEGTSVRLMTIHQAKGLEFPIVVLPDLNRKAPGSHLDAVKFHPELGPLVRPPSDRLAETQGQGERGGDDSGAGKSLGWLTYQAIEQREEDEEAHRLFYVATTRAKDALILSAGLGPSENAASPAMVLLDQRFDRRTGACRVPLPDGCAAPRITVTVECPPAPVGRAVRDGGGVSLDEIAALISGAPVPSEAPPPPVRRAPRFVDLDPGRGLPPRAARIDRLTRSILADPQALQPGQLWAVANRAARNQDPAAPAPMVVEALDRLRPWIEGMLGRELAAATAIERDLDWTLPWPAASANPTIFQGRIDLLARDRQGVWRLIVISDAAAPDARERLRLLLSAHAASGLGFGPISQAWHLRLGTEGGLRGEDRFGTAEIDAAVREWLASRCGTQTDRGRSTT